jgi:Zn-dependent metalloprotease
LAVGDNSMKGAHEMQPTTDPTAVRTPSSQACCYIAPPDLLSHLAKEGSDDQRDAALRTIAASASMRTRRSLVNSFIRDMGVEAAAAAFMVAPSGRKRTVHDVENGGRSDLPGTKARGEGDPESSDAAVNEAYDGSGTTYDFYKEIYERDSIDGRGMEIVSSVHYGVGFDNAFWQGSQMVYGDGSGRIFQVGAFTKAIDVIAHELTHGVTQFSAGLIYSKDSGALNEHFSDALGSLVKQYSKNQTADQADWLLGEGTLMPDLGKALRSLKDPGSAYQGDRQPGHMDDYIDLPDDNDPANDNGGVHINSGIPNRAFFLAAEAIGGYAWEKTGKIWYHTLTEHMKPNSQFPDAAEATVESAGQLFGSGSDEEKAVQRAWQEVGVTS